jgi:peroxiredoxin
MNIGSKVPSVTFKYRVRTDGNDITYVNDGPENPFEWKDVTSKDIFAGKRVVIFSLPGAFTPTCSTLQVPHYEQDYDLLKSFGIDDVYVVSVNDTFVMRKWMIDQKIKNLKFIPDGTGEFTQKMGMLVCKDHLGFGNRSWRYSAVINDGVVEQFFQEPGINQTGEDNDPYGQTSPETMYQYLSSKNDE